MAEAGDMRLGIIGTGFIAEAMVQGILRDGRGGISIAVSPRGSETANRLAQQYPEIVTVASSNQAVLEAAHLVILAVRPDRLEPVLADLEFGRDHHVVSVVAGFGLSKVARMVEPASRVSLAIPLPAMARGSAPTVITPADDDASALFKRAGPVIEVDSEEAYAALGTSTAIMATHFAIARAATDWLARHGVPAEKARDYVCQLQAGLARTAEDLREHSFQQLETAHATPGSFNDFLRNRLSETGAFSALENSLDVLLARMRGS